MLKKISIGLGSGIAFIGLLLLVSYMYHTMKVSQEKKAFPPIGEMVEVNGHDMHVYTKGAGAETIVFLSGGGTSAPALDFKPLGQSLTDRYEIAVVEKAGYGWSEVADVSRDIDVILEETREALTKAGVEAPYVLAPHSMSGLEAIRWAQKYPEEVEAIIGLDTAVPEAYDELDIPSPFVQNLLAFVARSGVLRFIPPVVNQSAAIDAGFLSTEDEEAYRALFHRGTSTKNMREEIKQVNKNAEKVKDNGVPHTTPMYFFISNGDETGIDSWREVSADYLEQVDSSSYMYMGPEHYIHAYEPEIIAEEIDDFINEIKK